MPTAARLLLRNDDGTVVDFLDGTTYALLDDGLDMPVPQLKGNLGEEEYEDRQITLRFRFPVQADYDTLTANVQRIEQLLREARGHDWFGWGPRIELEYRPGIGSGTARVTEPLYADVLDGTLEMPADFWGGGQLKGAAQIGTLASPCTLTLRCEPPLRGSEERVRNLLLNPSFERGATAPGESWANLVGTSAFDTENKHHGIRSVLVSSSTAGHGIRQTITLTANRAYILSAWVYVTAGTLTMEIIDITNQLTYRAIPQGDTSNAWKHISLTFVTNSVTSWAVDFKIQAAVATTFRVDATMLSPYQPTIDMDVRGVYHLEDAAAIMGLPGGVASTYDLTAIVSPSFANAGVRRNCMTLNGSTQWAWLNNKPTHLYERDPAALFTGNLINSSLPYNYFMGTAPDNHLYLGDTRGSFRSLTFHVGTGRVGGTIVIEYSQGAGVWGALTVTDDTTTFSVTGRNLISWTVPGDWAKDNVNGISAYWVRWRVTVALTTIPTQATTEVNRSSFFDDLAVSGQSFSFKVAFRTGTDITSRQALYSKWTGGGAATRNASFMLNISESGSIAGTLAFSMRDLATSNKDVTTLKVLKASTWYEVFCIHDAVNDRNDIWIAELDVDTKVARIGRLTGVTSDMNLSAAVFILGAFDDGTDPDSAVSRKFNGRLDEFVPFGEALTEDKMNHILRDDLQKYRALNGGTELPVAFFGAAPIYPREDTEVGRINFLSIADIPGDMDALAEIRVKQTNGAIAYMWCARRSRGEAESYKLFYSQGDTLVYGADTSAVVDADTISGNAAEITFATDASLVARVSWTPDVDALSLRDLAGRFRFMLRLQPSVVSQNTLNVRFRIVTIDAGIVLFTGPTIAVAASSNYKLLDLGLASLLNFRRLDEYEFDNNYRVQIQVQRVTGSQTTTRIDWLGIWPVDEYSAYLRAATGGAGIEASESWLLSSLLSVQDRAYQLDSSARVDNDSFPDLIGAIPKLKPNAEQRLYFLLAKSVSDPPDYGTDDDRAEVTVRYIPRYLHMRGD